MNLNDAIAQAIDDAQAHMFTAMPARVTRVHGTTINAQPAGKVWRSGPDGRVAESLPELQAVPLAFPHNLSWTVAPGDLVLLVFASHPIDQFTAHAGNDPSDDRRHALDDAIALPLQVRGAAANVNPSDTVVRQRDLEALKAAILEASLTDISGALALLLSKLNTPPTPWPNCTSNVKAK